MPRIPYVCPDDHQPLRETALGLMRADGKAYEFVCPQLGIRVPDFAGHSPGGGQRASLEMYGAGTATEIYRNFLDWLFESFRQDETAFRRDMARRLQATRGQAVLVTGCGLGDDLPAILELIGPEGEIHAQDISTAMACEAARRWFAGRPEVIGQVSFSAGDAQRLPFADGAFDAAFHFGGINLFDDVRAGIAEMNRVVRPGGRVVVSDEGVGPWLRHTDYGRMVIANNPLWAHEAPIALLPPSALDVALSWILGNCFWVIEFTVSPTTPPLDPHVPHEGARGGSMWTRHRGQMEGVTPETRERVLQAAAAAGLSVHDWLEQALGERLGGNRS